MDLATTAAVLSATPLFRDVHPSVLSHVAAVADERSIPPGQHVFFEGDLATEFYVVAHGAIRVFVPAQDEELDLGLVRAGRMFGEGGLLDGGPRLASALAVEPTVLLAIPRDAWLELLDHGDLSRRTLAAIGGSLRHYAHHAVDLLFVDMEIPDVPPGEGVPGPSPGAG